MKKLAVKPISILIILALLLVGLAACQPQMVEVEITRVVTETIIEQVESEVVEVEVTREVSVLAEAEVESQTDPVEAAGSEEDGGSPFIPTAGQRVKIVPTRVASAGWVDIETIASSEPMMRLLAENDQQLVIIHQLETAYGHSTLMVNSQQWIFSQTVDNLPAVAAISASTPVDLVPLLGALQPTDELVELSIQMSCDRCAGEGQSETVVLLWPDSGLTITIDQDENVPLLDVLLNQLRPLHKDQRQRATLRAFRLGEWDSR